MPFSKKQLRWAHTPSGQAALGPATVQKWDQEVKGQYNKLPETSKGSNEAALKKKLRLHRA